MGFLILIVILIIIIIIGYLIIDRKSYSGGSKGPNRRPAEIPKIAEEPAKESCGEEFIDEGGICKRRPGDRCLTRSECPANYFCFNGLCTRQPITWDECVKTTCNDGLICLDSHLLRLTEHDRFGIVPGWWALRNCRDITDSGIEGFVYVLDDEAIYWVPTRSIVDRPKRIASNRISNDSIRSIFFYRNYFTALTDRGKLYRGFNLRHGHVDPWNWEEIEFLAGRDLTGEFISSVTVSNDGLLDLRCSSTETGNRRLIYLNRWLEETTSNPRTRISYSNNRITTLYLYPYSTYTYSAELYLYDNILLYTIDNIIDACIDPTNPTNLIVIKSNGIYRYRLYHPGNKTYFIPENSVEIKDYRLLEDPLVGEGVSLFATGNDIWLLSKKECIRI